MTVAALLRGLHVPLDGLRLGLHRAQILKAHDGVVRSSGAHQLAVFEKHHLTRVGQKGRDVGRHKVFARALTKDKRSRHARGVDDAGLVFVHKADRVCAVRFAQGGGKSVQQVRLGLAAFGYEVHQHFGVCL